MDIEFISLNSGTLIKIFPSRGFIWSISDNYDHNNNNNALNICQLLEIVQTLINNLIILQQYNPIVSSTLNI